MWSGEVSERSRHECEKAGSSVAAWARLILIEVCCSGSAKRSHFGAHASC